MFSFLRTALVVFGCFGLLLGLSACGGTPAMTERTASYTVTLALDSATAGDRTATITVADSSGQSITDADVLVAPTMLSMGMASPQVQAIPDGKGHYTAGPILISMIGEWELDVIVNANGASETARFMTNIPSK